MTDVAALAQQLVGSGKWRFWGMTTNLLVSNDGQEIVPTIEAARREGLLDSQRDGTEAA